MTLRFNTGELREFIHQYYEKEEGVDASASFIPTVEEYRGGENCIVEFSIYKTINILGKEKIAKEKITKDDITEIIKKSFEESDYEVSEVTLDAGIEYDWEGYGMAERRIPKPYFNGIVVDVEKVRVKKMNR